MVDDFDQALETDRLACSPQMDKSASGDLLESLAVKLSGVFPEETEIVRGGWVLSSKKPVVSLSLKLGDVGFHMERDKKGTIVARKIKIVRGVTISTKDVPTDQWVADLAETLAYLAEQNKATREALKKFVIG